MVLILMGVAGSGKSTIGELIARRLGWKFYEGDDFHPKKNRAKMRRGEPLTDEDRRPWLAALAGLIFGWVREREDAVLTCSALKESYRKELGAGMDSVRLVYLAGSKDLIAQRLGARRGHFFNPALLQSQLDALEEPHGAITIDIAGTPDQIAEKIIEALHLTQPG
jgi:gluconokinase